MAEAPRFLALAQTVGAPPPVPPDGSAPPTSSSAIGPAAAPASGEAESPAVAFLDWIDSIWNFRLITLEGSQITVGSIVIFLALLTLGVIAVRMFSRRFVAFLGRRLKLSVGGAAALQAVMFYVLLSVVVLLAMHVVNIPITIFAVLGGALAIGIGFGSQNIVSNFISGLIILVEQPIRVGDMVKIDDVFGTVRSIGARSTRVVDFDNYEILIPNSKIIENNVTNLTLSDDRIRAKIIVGVAYGSPVRTVEKLLLQAATEHDHVLKDPPPRVLFSEFGDNALIFTTFLHVRVQSIVDRLKVQSDVRFRIDELFNEAGLVIAFPQRDIHLDTLRPLEVRLMDKSSATASAKPANQAD